MVYGSNLFHLVIGSKGGGLAPHNHSKPTSHRRWKKIIWASSASFTELNCQVSLINIKNCRCNDRVYTCRYTRCVGDMCVVVIVVIFPRTNTHNILRIEGGVWSLLNSRNVLYVPLVPWSRFWYHKLRKIYLVTYLEDFFNSIIFSMISRREEKSEVLHPSLRSIDH